MRTAVYDNPATYRRECWQDGRVVYAITADALLMKDPPGLIFFGANIGKWKSGQLVGDQDAIKAEGTVGG